MAECGAWKSFLDLEENLSLDELMQLYEASMKRQERLIKTIASALGAEFDDDDEESKESKKLKKWQYDPKTGGHIEDTVSERDIRSLPINLGYTKM